MQSTVMQIIRVLDKGGYRHSLFQDVLVSVTLFPSSNLVKMLHIIMASNINTDYSAKHCCLVLNDIFNNGLRN